MESKCGAVILAGGQGSRFGGTNKAELFCRGESFYSRIKKELDLLGLPCFFSAGMYPPPKEAGLEVIEDLPVEGADGPIGPMGWILSCFEETQCDLLFFLSCDLPLFHRQMAEQLLERGCMADQGRENSASVRPVRPLLPACAAGVCTEWELPADALFGSNFLYGGGNGRGPDSGPLVLQRELPGGPGGPGRVSASGAGGQRHQEHGKDDASLKAGGSPDGTWNPDRGD